MTTDEIKNSGNFTMTGVKIEHSDAGFYYMHTTDKIRALADEFEKEWGPSPLGELEARVVSALRQLAEERTVHLEYISDAQRLYKQLVEEREREERLHKYGWLLDWDDDKNIWNWHDDYVLQPGEHTCSHSDRAEAARLAEATLLKRPFSPPDGQT